MALFYETYGTKLPFDNTYGKWYSNKAADEGGEIMAA
jgi:hypothetical protein